MEKLSLWEEGQALNFREVRGGKIAPGTLYRSSHPIKDNKQEKIIALLAAETRIASVLNLADTRAEISVTALFAPWYNKLLKKKRVIALGMDDSRFFSGARFNGKLKRALRFIIRTEGPWLIHCYAGVDRTGFVSIVLEALMGASIEEITSDYFASFSGAFEPGIYGGINGNMFSVMKHMVIQQLLVMDDSQAITDENLQGLAELYLQEKIALRSEDIESLKAKLACSPREAP